MPPQSRGNDEHQKPPSKPNAIYSRSTPNLPTLRSLQPSSALSPEIITSPSEPTSLDDFSLDGSRDPAATSPASSESEGDGQEEVDRGSSLRPPRPLYNHQSRSHTYLGPSAFAPPFYNRPPTPLPPSPSLTSLLRPNFSNQSSRPNTPDPSSDEGVTPQTRTASGTGAQTPHSAAADSSLASSFRSAKPIARASPKVPTYEYYGFTLYLTSSLAFIVYLLWSFLPSPFLHQLGIYYYPNRWWALAIPAWTVMLIVYIYVALASYNTEYLTLDMGSVECLVDEAANIAVVDATGKIVRDDRPSWRSPSPHREVRGKQGKGKNGGHSRQGSGSVKPELDWRLLWNEGTDAVMDIPIGGVCEILYGAGDVEDHEFG
nr:meiotically up-regulated gene 84 protein [Quercus suber]